MSTTCACGRLDLGDCDFIGSTDTRADERGSHTVEQCRDVMDRRLPRMSRGGAFYEQQVNGSGSQNTTTENQWGTLVDELESTPRN